MFKIYSATHPLEYEAKNSEQEFLKPINFTNNIWICVNVSIGHEVTIGNNGIIYIVKHC